MIRTPVLCLLVALSTVGNASASALHSRGRRGTHRNCGMMDFMALESINIDDVDMTRCSEILESVTPTGTPTNADSEDIAFFEAILPDLCGECMAPIATVTSALAEMNCDLQLATIATMLQTFGTLGGADASDIAQVTSAINQVIAQGITEITVEEFEGLHNVASESCQVTDMGGMTCAQEFVALGSPTNDQHAAVCQRISDACVVEATSIATMLNSVGSDLCGNNAMDTSLRAQLCQQHTASSVLDALSQQCNGNGPTLSPEQMNNQNSAGTFKPQVYIDNNSKDGNDKGKGISGSMIALIAIAALGATVGAVFAGRSLWLKKKSSYNPVEMYDFNDNNDEEDDDWDDENNDDKLLSVLGTDTPLGLQSPQIEAANRLELMTDDE